MVIPFFGKKPADSKKGGNSRGDSDRDKADDAPTTTMDFAQGDMGRALAAAAGKIQVTEAAYEDNAAAVEEAAILYANANNSGARAVLEAAIDSAGGKASENVWNMLFDLYRLTGEKQAFDARGINFAQQFEISPPVWEEAEPSNAGALRDASPAVNLSGNLSGTAKTQFEQLVRVGTKTGKIRIELSRLKGIDEAGCSLMIETLAALKRAKVKVALLGAKHALSLVEPKVKVGEKEGPLFWHAAMAFIQQMGDQDRFEQVALDYAITFEESPPSYEPPETVNLNDTSGIELKIDEPVRDDFVMDGVIAGGQPEVVRKLAAYAAQRAAVEIDASGLKRLEFVSAGALFNQFATFQTQGKLAVIRHPNAMVAALLRVMGIDQVAQIELKRK